MTYESADNRLIIHIPRGTKPTDVIRLPDHGAAALIHLEAGAEAVATGVLSNSAIEVILEDGAKFELLRVAEEGPGGSCESTLTVRQSRDSVLRSFYLTRGGRMVKDNLYVTVNGEGAASFINGLHVLSGDSQAESRTHIEHTAPSTTSHQLYKSIVRDKAHSIFFGRILVRREAQLTQAYQLNKNLILGPEGRVNTKPQLEIFADDVKCSHGAAIGQMDEDQIFYLQARGIDREAAASLLVQGFIQDVLSQISHTALRAEVGRHLGP